MLELIEAAFAQVEWADEGPQGRITRVSVFDQREPELSETAREKLFPSSAGACVADWMTGEDPRSSPEGLFVQMALQGFVDNLTMLAALEEFAKIDQAEWARTMSAALRRLLIVRGELFEEDD
jgi:hypothetical protein